MRVNVKKKIMKEQLDLNFQHVSIQYYAHFLKLFWKVQYLHCATFAGLMNI